MKKLVLFVLLLPALVWAQSGAFGHGGMSVSQLLPIINDAIDDSSRWTDGSTVNAIKPRDGKTVEADSGKFGALHVTGNTILDGNLTMVTTAGEQIRFGTGSNAAPELSSAGDTDTGIRFTGGNKMQLVQGGLNSHTFRPYRYTMTYSDGDTLALFMDGTTTSIQTGGAQLAFSSGTSSVVISGGMLYPSAHNFIDMGRSAKKFKDYWGSGNIYADGLLAVGTTTPGAKMEIAGSKSDDTLFSVYNDVAGLTARDSSFTIRPDGSVGNNGMVTIKRTVSLVDQAEYTPKIPAGMCGWGKVMIGDFVEWARFHFKADGTVTLETNSTNVGTTNDVDAKLNIYDGGTGGVIIENQLGSTLTAAMVIECYTP